MQFAKKDNHRELKQVLDVQKQCFPPSIQTETESRGPELLIISANDAVNFEYGNIAFRRTNLIKQQQKQLKRKKTPTVKFEFTWWMRSQYLLPIWCSLPTSAPGESRWLSSC